MNSSTNKEIVSAFGLQNIDSLPTPIAVVNVNPKDYKVINNSAYNYSTSSGQFSIFTTSKTRKTYITNISAGYAKNAACDSINLYSINIYQNGILKTIIPFPLLTLTAQNEFTSITFKNPLLVDKDTAVVFTGTATAGSVTRAAAVQYYEIEDYE